MTSSTSASTVRSHGVQAKPKKASGPPPSGSQPTCAAQLTAVGAVKVRRPATTPIRRASSKIIMVASYAHRPRSLLDCSSRMPAGIASEIDHDIAFGLAAADQHVAVGRRLDWVGPIANGAGDEPGLAIVADPGTARPSYRHIARLGEFEEALERRAPRDIEAAAREGYQRPRAFRPGRQMRRPVWRRGDARRHRWSRAETL